MTERKVVLVNPNSGGNYVQAAIQRENLGLGYLSAELKDQGFGTEIIDSRITGQSPEEAAQEVLDQDPFMVGFSIIAKDACNWVERVARLVKTEKPQIHFAAGNYFPTMQPSRALQYMPHIDSVVIREGDITLPELALCLTTGSNWQQIQGLAYRTGAEDVTANPLRPLVKDLDRLPFPDHYAPRFRLDEFAIEGSRGCYCRCTFCSIPTFMRAESSQVRWRNRSPESIGREIRENQQRHPEFVSFGLLILIL